MARTYRIAVIPGDGTGPEVIREALKVLLAAAKKYVFNVETTSYDLGGMRYLKTGETISDETLNELRGYDSILLGAIGHTDIKPGILEKGVLLKIRFGLDQYINLRPVRLYPCVKTPIAGKSSEDIYYTVIRENVGDMYAGIGGAVMIGTPHEVAEQTMIYNRFMVDRCLKYAFEYTLKYGKKATGRGDKNTLALIGKSNVLTHVFDLWNRAFEEMGRMYPDVTREYYHVDATVLYQVWKPEMFDVVVTTNLFGDIITDLAAITQGGLGVAAGGNINPDGVSMFEPIGGTAPFWTGKNAINPLAAIGACALMLRHLREDKAADAIEKAISETTPTMRSMDAGEMGMSCTDVGDAVAGRI